MTQLFSEIDPKTGLHILRGHISNDSPNCCQIAVYCPYCGEDHIHGWPSRITNTKYLEHRSAHCFDTPTQRRTESPFYVQGYLIGIQP
ncbi:hypothetical protein SAMN05660420_01448 [Desulfuromusa kysingii]|uniref:Uncharacterized protein n=1 Tax=Desulfuromusa kysingii TaxID=37625 RepID=A0A1H3YZN1_9BACT|nr:hypothetical protein SAMN05660420_01448 [Desulfuromusa kysingii]